MKQRDSLVNSNRRILAMRVVAVCAASLTLGLGATATTLAAGSSKEGGATRPGHTHAGYRDDSGNNHDNEQSGTSEERGQSSSSSPKSQPSSKPSSKPDNGSNHPSAKAPATAPAPASATPAHSEHPAAPVRLVNSSSHGAIPAARFAAPALDQPQPAASEPVYAQAVLGVTTVSEPAPSTNVVRASHADLAAFTAMHGGFLSDNSFRLLLLLSWGAVNAGLIAVIRRRRKKNQPFTPINLGTWRYAK
jgi:hypothetical protein